MITIHWLSLIVMVTTAWICGFLISSSLRMASDNKEEKVKYYLCTDVIYQRLMKETQSLFERYPEDDGIMIFAPDIRIERQRERIQELEAEINKLKED